MAMNLEELTAEQAEEWRAVASTMPVGLVRTRELPPAGLFGVDYRVGPISTPRG